MPVFKHSFQKELYSLEMIKYYITVILIDGEQINTSLSHQLGLPKSSILPFIHYPIPNLTQLSIFVSCFPNK